MSFKDIFRALAPSVEDDSCEYLLSRIIEIKGKSRPYRFSNVTPGLATLLNRKYKGQYFKNGNLYLLNAKNDRTPYEISCTLNELENLLAELKKGDK